MVTGNIYAKTLPRVKKKKHTIRKNLDLLDSTTQLVIFADKQRNPRIQKRVRPFSWIERFFLG